MTEETGCAIEDETRRETLSERSRSRIESRLADLKDRYQNVTINQITVGVPPAGYQAAIDRSANKFVTTRVRVTNDEGQVLVIDSDDADGPVTPGGAVDTSEPLEVAACETVKDATNLSCSIDGVYKAVIAGVHDETDPDTAPIYRLLVVFSGSVDGGAPNERVAWQRDAKVAQIDAVL
jgi:ADP-ribose pyrophosphatase YjhB (NUDIX family)